MLGLSLPAKNSSDEKKLLINRLIQDITNNENVEANLRESLMGNNDVADLIVGIKSAQVDISQINVKTNPKIFSSGVRDSAKLFESYLNSFFSQAKIKSVLKTALINSRTYPLGFVMTRLKPNSSVNKSFKNTAELDNIPQEISLINIPAHKV